MEKLSSEPEGHEINATRVRLVDHETEDGERIVVLADVYSPDDESAYEAYIETDGEVSTLTVLVAYEAVDHCRRWIRCIDFDDGSSIVIDVQRFEMHYLRGKRYDFLVPHRTSGENY